MDKMFIENKSKYSFNETIEKLTEAVDNSDWKIIHVHDLQQLMRNNGHEVLAAKVMEVCSPSFAYELLSKDEERIYSNMMPCRLSIFEKSNGETYISRMDIEKFSSQLGGVIKEIMSKAFHGAEALVAHVVA